MTSRRVFQTVVVTVATAAAVVGRGAELPPAIGLTRRLHAVVSSPVARTAYLGRATLWRDPGEISPEDLFKGPSDVFPYTVEQATSPDGIACTFSKPGRVLAGKSPKFTCLAADDQDLRLKYWDPDTGTGNRETFATVAATRLMWALGFMSVPALPMNVRCEGCPEDPMGGGGDRRLRRYVAMWQVSVPGPRIISQADADQGWSWRELDDAITALPAGEERTRQRTHFAALTLLGVLIQHGDRKPEQQALYCVDEVDLTAGEIRPQGDGTPQEMLFERPGATACPRAAAAIVDAGATFGGAGRTSNATTAKMNLESWRRKPVFASGGNACRGELTVSLAAGGGALGSPTISEEGRQFLVERLRKLSPAHLRAIFTVARIDQIRGARAAGQDDGQASAPGPVDAWVAAFQDKVHQIEARHCQSSS